MAEYIYPTRANKGDKWLKVMLDAWKDSNLPFLCFPWILFNVNTITDKYFWLYMYYSYNQSDISYLQGVIEYRISVIDWGPNKFLRKDTYPARFNEEGKVWFLCDRFEKIRNIDKSPLLLTDFDYKFKKLLKSTIRDSIPPVRCNVDFEIVNSYPN